MSFQTTVIREDTLWVSFRYNSRITSTSADGSPSQTRRRAAETEAGARADRSLPALHERNHPTRACRMVGLVRDLTETIGAAPLVSVTIGNNGVISVLYSGAAMALQSELT